MWNANKMERNLAIVDPREALALAPHFWAAVEDCLVSFHRVNRGEAAQKVTSLWRQLPTAEGANAAFSDIVYHAEPWRIGCNLAGRDLPISEHQSAYQEILVRNGLTALR